MTSTEGIRPRPFSYDVSGVQVRDNGAGQITVRYNGKEYTFNVVKNDDGTYSLCYDVVRGDHLGRIIAAVKEAAGKLGFKITLPNDSVKEIGRANGIKNVNLIYPGQRIEVKYNVERGSLSQWSAASTEASKLEPSGDTEHPTYLLPPIRFDPGLESIPDIADSNTVTRKEPPAADLVEDGLPETSASQNTAPVVYNGSADTDALAVQFIRQLNPKLNDDNVGRIWSIVKQESAKYGIDPLLVLAVMAKESLFKPRAGSYAGCLGLMQILPATGRTLLAENFNKRGLGQRELQAILFDPEWNIKLGVLYLARYCEVGKKGLIGLAGYNAGHGPKKGYSSAGELAIRCSFSKKFNGGGSINIKSYDQTKHYIYCIYNAYEALKKGDIEVAMKFSQGSYKRQELIQFIDNVRAGNLNGWTPAAAGGAGNVS